MKKLYCFLIAFLAIFVYSCMNSQFTNPSQYIRYAGSVNGGVSGSGGKVVYHILAINIEGEGSVLFNDSEYTKELKLLKGTKVRLEAQESLTSQDKFQGWSGSISSTNKVISELLIDKDITILATFGIPKIEKKLTVGIRKGGTVFIDEGQGEVEYKNDTDETKTIDRVYNVIESQTVTIWLRAEPNETAIDWNGWSGLGPDTITNKKIKVELDKSKFISASFGTDKYLSIVNNDSIGYIEYSINNGNFIKYTNKIVEIEVNDDIKIRAIPHNTRTHEFKKWSNGSTQSSIEILDVKNDITLTADWKEIKRTLTIEKETGNVLSFKVDGATHNYTGTPITISLLRDSTVKIEAVEKYYPFISWSGDASGNSKTTNVLLDDNKTIKASFETGVFDVYDNPTLNNYNASEFDKWVINVSDFGNEEIPIYNFYTKFTWGSPSTSFITEYHYEGDTSKAAGFDIKPMNYYMYKGENYYMKRDKPSDNYNKGVHANRLKRFYFYRFTGKNSGQDLDNTLCVVDTYTKLLWAYAVPSEFKIILTGLPAVPTKWEAVEILAKSKLNYDYKFYEYDPIGYVDSIGNVILFESFKKIQRAGAAVKPGGYLWAPTLDKEKKIRAYLPKEPSVGTATIDFTLLNPNGGNRSPYLE